MLKRLFYASASIMMLALAYHLGASTATAQAPGNPVVAGWGLNNDIGVVTANGEVYYTNTYGATWTRTPNVFGGTTPAAQQTFGQLKAQYRK